MALSIPQVFTLFRIVAKSSEVGDANMPRNMFQAVALFHATGKTEAGRKCHDCLVGVLTLLETGPDGKSEVAIGNPWLCWECGFLGIPTTLNESGEGECRLCSSSSQTNLVEGIQPDGSMIPWIEKKTS
jgi:hypothetical protein